MEYGNDFFSSGQTSSTITISAVGVNGKASKANDRHSVSVMARVLDGIKRATAHSLPVIAAAALVANIGVICVATGDTNYLSAQTRQSAADLNVKARMSNISGLSIQKITQEELKTAQNQILDNIDAVLERQNANGGGNDQTEFNLTKSQVNKLSIDSISQQARPYINSFGVVDKSEFKKITTLDADGPLMLPMQNSRSKQNVWLSKNSTDCVMQVSGFNDNMAELFGNSIDKFSKKDLASLQRIVVIHEAAHCEEAAMRNYEGIFGEKSFATHMIEVADGFKNKVEGSIDIDFKEKALSMMKERYADTKTTLYLSNYYLGKLPPGANDNERQLAINEFKQDVSMLKKMRSNERSLIIKDSSIFNDHDTLHIVEKLEIKIIANAGDEKKWNAFTDDYLHGNKLSATAGAITIKETLREKKEIMQFASNQYKESLDIILENSYQKIKYLEKELEENSVESAKYKSEFERIKKTKGHLQGQEKDIAVEKYIYMHNAQIDNDVSILIENLVKNRNKKNEDGNEDGDLSYEQKYRISAKARESFPAIIPARFVESLIDSKKIIVQSMEIHQSVIKETETAVEQYKQALKASPSGKNDSSVGEGAVSGFINKSLWAKNKSESAGEEFSQIRSSYLSEAITKKTTEETKKMSHKSDFEEGSLNKKVNVAPTLKGLLKILGPMKQSVSTTVKPSI